MLVLCPKLVLLLTDILSDLPLFLLLLPCACETRCLLYFYDVRSHMVRATIQERHNSNWTSPGDNTPQDTNYTATCLPSGKLYKLDESDMQDTAGEARINSSVIYSYGPPHMAKQKQDDQLEHTYSSYVRIRM